MLTYIHGTFVHSISENEIEYVENGLLGFDEAGILRIVERNVSSESRLEEIVNKNGDEIVEVIRLSKYQFVMPGLVDTHTVCLLRGVFDERGDRAPMKNRTHARTHGTQHTRRRSMFCAR